MFDQLARNPVLTGLWQVADMEKDGTVLDPDKGADWLQAYAAAGFRCFDMADHYGSAEIIAGRMLARHGAGPDRPLAFTKWCPKPGPMTAEVVRAGIDERCARLGVERIDLLQFHWWSFEHPEWLNALHELAALRQSGHIGEIGVTNFDAAHVALAVADGIPLATNQVSCSLLDRRAIGPLADVCARTGVRLLTYGTLCGGFLADRWLGAQEPREISDWSKMKYKRFIDVTGGWEAFQSILAAARAIADKHAVSLSNVATRWVMDQPAVAGVIIGARLGEAEHIADNARLAGLRLDGEDMARLSDVFARTAPIPGDCGDEYRKPPFLTASGDLSHHLDALPSPYQTIAHPFQADAAQVLTGSKWEDIAGYCRAQRIGDRIFVSGTTATADADRAVAPGSAAAQTTFILDKIAAALSALGAGMEHVVRTRIYLRNAADVGAVSAEHGRVFGAIKPANTLFGGADLIGDYLVEIEAEAMLP